MLAPTILCATALAMATTGCGSSPQDRAASTAVPLEPASLFLSPGGSDNPGCKRASPCRTLARAYRLARPGEVVELAAGRYGEQSIQPRRKSGRGGHVVFRPAAGARAEVERLTIDAGVQGIELQGLHFPDGWEVGPADDGPPAGDIVFRRTTGTTFSIMNAKAVSIVGGSYGPSVDDHPQVKVYNPENTYLPTDILISGVRFHDFTRSADDVHTECLQVYAGLRVTIDNNRFSNCDGTGAVQLTTLGATSLRQVLVENNWFDDSGDAHFAVQASLNVEDLVFRYNSALKPLIFTECTEERCGPARLVGNVMPWNPSTCADGVIYAHNVFKDGRCGSTDKQVELLRFVDAQGFDLHLARSSPANCTGDPESFPRRDIDGQPRDRRYRPDAGADQVQRGTGDGVPARCRGLG